MKMSVESIVYSDKTVYFIPKELNMLFSCSNMDEQIKMIDIVPEEDGYTQRQFNGLCKVDNKIVLVPYAAKRIWIYDLELKTWNSVDIGKYISEENDSKFSGCVQWEGAVYLLGYGFNGILSLNLNTYELEDIFQKDGFCLWGQKVAIDGCSVSIALPYEKKYAVLNLETKEVTFVDVDISDGGLSSVGYDGTNKIILPSKGNRYYVMKGETNIEEYGLPHELSKSLYNGLVVSDKYIYGYSSWGKSFLVNREKNDVIVIDSDTFFVEYIKGTGFIESQKGVLNFYDDEFVLKKTILLTIDNEKLEEYYYRYSIMSKIYNENDSFSLSQYLKKIVQTE